MHMSFCRWHVRNIFLKPQANVCLPQVFFSKAEPWWETFSNLPLRPDILCGSHTMFESSGQPNPKDSLVPHRVRCWVWFRGICLKSTNLRYLEVPRDPQTNGADENPLHAAKRQRCSVRGLMRSRPGWPGTHDSPSWLRPVCRRCRRAGAGVSNRCVMDP